MRVTLYVELPDLPEVTPPQLAEAAQAGVRMISPTATVSSEQPAMFIPNRNWRKRHMQDQLDEQK